MTYIIIGAVVVIWPLAALLVFGLCRAAGRPTPKPGGKP
jgi:hypothetical protein